MASVLGSARLGKVEKRGAYLILAQRKSLREKKKKLWEWALTRKRNTRGFEGKNFWVTT